MTEKLLTDIFKFVAIRPTQMANEEDSAATTIRDARAEGADGQRQLEQIARPLATTEGALQKWSQADFSGLKPLVAAYRTLVHRYEQGPPRGLADDPADAPEPPVAADAARDAGIANLSEAKINTLLEQAFDAYYIGSRTGPDAGSRLELATSALRALHFARGIANGSITDANEAKRTLSATPLVPGALHRHFNQPAAPTPPPSRPAPPQGSPDTAKKRELLQEFEATQTLLETLRSASPLLKAQSRMTSRDDPGGSGARVSITSAPRFRDAVAANVAAPAQRLLGTLSIKDTTSLPSASLALERHLTTLSAKVQTFSGDAEFIGMAKAKDIVGLDKIFLPQPDLTGDPSSTPDVNMSGQIRPLGIGDLKVVKQKLLAYVPGEVAHIENVLKGEFKDRKHRVLDRAETMVFTSEEEAQETERDTQSTERFELKKEAEQVIKEDMSVQAGVTVTGGFGPVTVTAHGDFAYSTSKQESAKNSSNFAKDVVDRSVSRVQKKTKVERTTKTLHEVEETNSHGLDNKHGTGHITGVYRWVDKRYRAQVYNYGRRLMLELIVPEPAAFFRTSQMRSALELAGVTPPQPLVNAKGQPLTSSDITPSNYQLFTSRYNAAGVTPPPAEWVYITTVFDQGAIDNGLTVSKSVKDLIVPEGYILRFFNAEVSIIWVQGGPQFMLQIGEWGFHLLASTAVKHGSNQLVGPSASPDPWDDPIGPVPVSIIGYDINAYAVNVAANCERTTAHYEKWQLSTFDKIYTAYKALKSEYDQKVAQAQAQIGAVVIRGRNPQTNRTIEKAELKKLSITMLTGQHFAYFDAMTDPPGQPAQIPEVKPIEALSEGRYIQFFEQAFDWDQITYLFFPYFWGRKRNWIKVSNMDDPDPLFAQFLQAGAARVLLPVSPAYNEAVLYFLESKDPDVFKKIWQGGEPPKLDDPLFTSIAEEIKAQTDDLAGAVPEGEPWEFTVPTTLVWLQDGPELPVFEP
ncbi:hypothetical protein NKH93_10895 [Mesorhizobium sp. M0954]|uniref:hypothetical protein n=1 Tax=Mesorhizobium sp. M0954 TaxID=2957032 RepID=UPI0033359887